MMGVRDSFAEERRKTNETKENKGYLFYKNLTADLMALPTEYERLMAKNEIRNVLFKIQIANLKRRAIFFPEGSQTYFNQIPTIQYNPIQSTPYGKL